MMNRFVPGSCAILLLAAIGGCFRSGGLEDTVPIRGEVSYLGKPLESGEVRYVPVDPNAGRVARGTIDSHGKFRLTTLNDGDGALPGEYRIVVVVYEEQFDDISRREGDEDRSGRMETPSTPIPVRYYKPETSNLTDTVNDDHSGYKEIALVE